MQLHSLDKENSIKYTTVVLKIAAMHKHLVNIKFISMAKH